MVAVIKIGQSIHRAFHYNENKVKEGLAECIGAENYPVDVDKMGIKMKLVRLLKQIKMNENVTRNSVHISLNFDPSEKNIPKEKLLAIAGTYMEMIGFGKQPYLVYQHHDAGHPHLHLVTTNIEADGRRIDPHRLGIRKSEPARKYIETAFGLVKAGSQKKQAYRPEPVSVQRVFYGKTETRRAIQNVLDTVLQKYRYTSLPELNAVLKQYNVAADRGSENSRVYLNKGLVYRILDEQGKKIGVPIKASAFHNRPTLKFLEEKFLVNEAKRMPHKVRVRNAVDLALLRGKNLSVQGLVKELERQGIAAVLRENTSGFVYGITYVDHRTGCVFNGSALGRKYSAKAIQERCGQVDKTGHTKQVAQRNDQPLQEQFFPMNPTIQPEGFKEVTPTNPLPDLGKAVGVLMQPEQTSGYLPYQLKKQRKKKKRKQLSNNQ
jgi:hypothetical protein